MFDEKEGLLAREWRKENGADAKATLTKKQEAALKKYLEEWRRVIFFQNSVFFSARPVPGLSLEALPVGGGGAAGGGKGGASRADGIPLVGGGNGSPASAGGEAVTVIEGGAYGIPLEMMTKAERDKRTSQPQQQQQQQQQQVEESMRELTLDLRCANCAKAFADDKGLLQHCKETGHFPVGKEEVVPPTKELFVQYANVVLNRAMGERMARWGREYIDPQKFHEPTDKFQKPLGVRIFRAYTCEFNLHKPNPNPETPCRLGLTVDLRAKLMRTKSLLDLLCEGQGGSHPERVTYDAKTIAAIKRRWNNEVVIATYDKRCYSIMDIPFDQSPSSLPVQGLGISHAQYFAQKKKITLKYPNAKPMIQVQGRNDQPIYLPAEVVCANELDPQIRAKLPLVASYTPRIRHEAIEEMRRYLLPGAQKSQGGGLLPALGIGLLDERVVVNVTKLPLPVIVAAGVRIPEGQGGNWAPLTAKANYNANPNKVVQMNVVVVYHKSIKSSYQSVYKRVADMIRHHNATYQFGSKPFGVVEAGDMNQHWGAIERYFGGTKLPDNVFVLDLARPPRGQSNDPAYGAVKCFLAKGGFLSQFVNFQTHDHGRSRDARDEKKSTTILSGVARQILSKCGVRVWWVTIPKEVPLPAVFVGVDVFHAPRKFDPKEGKRKAGKESIAAIIVQILRSHNPAENSLVEIYCETESRAAGKEMELGPAMNRAVSNALKAFKVAPSSCYIFRDGVGDNSIEQVSQQEIPAVRQALSNPGQVVGAKTKAANVPLSYIVCQKRIATKFLTLQGDAIPCGGLITDIQGPQYKTFYINGTSPPFSTPKPVRFVMAHNDPPLYGVSPSKLAWALCHDYPNWAGPIKLPAPVQMAHKLAELAGEMGDCGDTINHKKFAGKIHFL